MLRNLLNRAFDRHDGQGSPAPALTVELGNPQTVHYLLAEHLDAKPGHGREPVWTVFRKGDLARWRRDYATEMQARDVMYRLEEMHGDTLSQEVFGLQCEGGWA